MTLSGTRAHGCRLGTGYRKVHGFASRAAARLVLALGVAALLVRDPAAFIAASQGPDCSRNALLCRRATAARDEGKSGSAATSAAEEPAGPAKSTTEVTLQPIGEATPETPAPEGGKRLRQFLALEPLDDDPSHGNQWAVDMEDTQLTDEDQRKKNTAFLLVVSPYSLLSATLFLYMALKTGSLLARQHCLQKMSPYSKVHEKGHDCCEKFAFEQS